MGSDQDEIFLEKVNAYLGGTISISDLDMWIMTNLPAFLPPRRDSISEFAGLIQLWVAERNQAHRTAEEIKELIAAYIRDLPTVTITNASIFSGATSAPISLTIGVPVLGAAPAMEPS